MNLPDDELTTAQAARLLQVAPSTVTRLVAAGQLEPCRKLPGRRGAFLFYRDVVETLASQREGNVVA